MLQKDIKVKNEDRSQGSESRSQRFSVIFHLLSVICVLSSLFSHLSYADWLDKFDGAYKDKESWVGLAWLKLAPGARGIALGNAYLSIVKDPTASWWNPAGLARSSGWQANFTHTQHFMGIHHEFFGISAKKGNNAYGIGMSGMFIEGIEHRNEQQDSLGEFGAYNFMTSFSYARSLGKDFNLGASVKGIYERIYIYELSGWLLDFGFTYTPYPGLWLAGVLTNFGPSPKFIDESFKPPRAWKLGVNYEIDKLLLSVDINKYIDALLQTGFGIEYRLTPYLFLRAGYIGGYYRTHLFSTGLGVEWKGLKIDYAWRPYEFGLGSAHIFTLTK